MDQTPYPFTRLDDATLEREVRAMQAAFVHQQLRLAVRWLRTRVATTAVSGSRAA